MRVLGAGALATVVTRDAWRAAVADPEGRSFELVFLDPPYRDSEDSSESGAVKRYLALLGGVEDNRPLVVLHHAAAVRFEMDDMDMWRVSDRRTFGTNAVSFFLR